MNIRLSNVSIVDVAQILQEQSLGRAWVLLKDSKPMAFVCVDNDHYCSSSIDNVSTTRRFNSLFEATSYEAEQLGVQFQIFHVGRKYSMDAYINGSNPWSGED